MLPEWSQLNNDGSSGGKPTTEAGLPEQFLNCLKQTIGVSRFKQWFAGQTVVSIAGDVLTVGVKSPFVIKWIRREFSQAAQQAAQQTVGISAQIRFEVDAQATELAAALFVQEKDSAKQHTLKFPQESDAKPGEVSSQKTAPSKQASHSVQQHPGHNQPRRQRLSPRRRRFASLENFVSGRCNHIALSMVDIICKHPGEQYNPLYLYGAVGVGKTHLLEGMHVRIRQLHSNLQVTYLTAEAFANFYTKALREKTLPAFRRRFRSVDVLVVDDIEFLDAKKGIQEEFCHTMQELLSYGRQVVLASDRHPRMLTHLRPDLSTRFLSGLVTRLETPDLETRSNIVRQHAKRFSLNISDDAVDYVARKFTRNVRELIGAINCLQTYHHLTKRPIGITATREVLKDLERDCLQIVRASDIQHAVCELFGVQKEELVSPRRTRILSQPRMLAMYLTRQWTQAAYHEIGKQFGGRNHSTVMSAERKVKEMLKRDEQIQIANRTWSAREIIAMVEEQLQAG